MLVAHETDINHEKNAELRQALALQTYEFLEGGPERKADIADFASGVSCDLKLHYPVLEESDAIDSYVSVLLQEVTGAPTVVATPEYRLAEAYFLQAARRLNRNPQRHSQETIDNFQELNEAIYGKPDKQVVNQMLTQIWERLDAVSSPATQVVLEKLSSGYDLSFDDGGLVSIPALPRPEGAPEGSDRLPVLAEETVEWLKESLARRYIAAREVFIDYFAKNNVVEGIDAPQISELFKRAINELDLDVAVVERENASLLSWSSADGAVIVGLDKKPIKSPEELFGLFVHEVGVHGVRSTTGAKSGIEALSVGLFTEAAEGEDPSYLTFEEGLASTLQSASQGKKESWSIAGMGLYLTTAFAHMGWSPRQIQEVMTNIRVALGASASDTEIDQDKIRKAQTAAATHTRRIFRGTPAMEVLKTSEGVTLHYAKDLAYAAGKIKAITYLNSIVGLDETEREKALDMLLSAKYDPTNSIQAALVESLDFSGRVDL